MRRVAVLFALVLFASSALSVRPARAQEITPTPPPTPTAIGDGHGGGDGGGGISLDLGRLAGDIADAIWSSLTQRLDAWVASWKPEPFALTDARVNILTHLVPEQTTQSPAVLERYRLARTAADALLGVAITVIGLGCLVRWDGLQGKEVLWVLGPRLVVGVLAANVGRDALDWLVRLTNSLCDVFTGGTLTALIAAFAQAGGNWGSVLLMAAVELTTLALLAARVFSQALFAVLVVVAPLVWVAWIVPAWQGVLLRWAGLLVALLLGQVVTVIALVQGATLAASVMAGKESDVLLGGAATIATLILATMAPSLVGAGIVSRGFGIGRVARTALLASRLFPAGAAASAASAVSGAGQAAAWEVARGGGMAWARETGAAALPSPKVIDVTWRPVLPAPRLALPKPD